jgi:hypothetical protein
MALSVIQDKAFGPVQIRLFGTDAVMADADGMTDLFQEGRLFLFHIESFRLLLLITVVQANGECK